MRPSRRLPAAPDLLTAAAVAGSVAVTSLSLAVGAFGLPGSGADDLAARPPVTEAPAHVVVLAPAPGAGRTS